MEQDPRNFSVPPPGRWFFISASVAIVLLLAITAGLVLAREHWILRQSAALKRQVAAGPRVLVVPIGRTAPTRTLVLPALTRGFDETGIYAKVPGYLRAVYVDKGDRIHKGEILARIESPETDKEVANYRANYELAKVTNDRDAELWRKNVISRQAYDDQHALMLQARATLAQYEALQSYEIVRAPYDGIVTARNVDPGHLVPEATAATSTTDAIISIARVKPLRVFTYVPQDVATFIHNGDQATITVRNYPGRIFEGTITRHPQALSPDSRTMLVEVDLPNDDQALYPGMYGRARFVVRMPVSAPLVPDDALIFRNNRVYVPVVRDNRLRLVEITLGYDNGVQVEATSGVHYNEMIAIDVGQAARDGEQVQPVLSHQAENAED
jgi:RND family efflux transporter MFP subunit